MTNEPHIPHYDANADAGAAARRREQMAALRDAEIDLSFFVAASARELRYDPDQAELHLRTLTSAVLTLARLRRLRTEPEGGAPSSPDPRMFGRGSSPALSQGARLQMVEPRSPSAEGPSQALPTEEGERAGPGEAPTCGRIEPEFGPAVVAETLKEQDLLDLAPTLLPLIEAAQSPSPDSDPWPDEGIGAFRRDDAALAGNPVPAAPFSDLVLGKARPAKSIRQRIVRQEVGRQAVASGLHESVKDGAVKFDMHYGLPPRRPELRDKNPRADDMRDKRRPEAR